MERYYQKGPESLENQGGMGHRPRKMERSLQDPLPRTGRRRRKVRKVRKCTRASGLSVCSEMNGLWLHKFKFKPCQINLPDPIARLAYKAVPKDASRRQRYNEA